MLFINWRIGLLSRSLKKLIDAEVADSLFDATLYSLEPQEMTIYQELYKSLENSQHLHGNNLSFDDLDILRSSKMMYISNIEEGVSEIYRITSCLGPHPFSHWTVHRHFIKPIEESTTIQALLQTSLVCNPNLPKWLLKNLPNQTKQRTPWKTQEAFDSIGPTMAIYSKKASKANKSQGESQRSVSDYENDLVYAKIMNRDRFAFNCGDVLGYCYGWGSNHMGQLGSVASAEEPSPLINTRPFLLFFPRPLLTAKNLLVKEIACGYTHTLAILYGGKLMAWGSNHSMQLGLGPGFPDIVPSPLPVKLDQRVKKISCGSEHSVALTETLQVFTWGQGEGGLLGLNHLETQSTPQEVAVLTPLKVTSIECGGLHTLALTHDGQVWSWGRGEGGQLGIPLDKLISTEEGDLYQNQPRVIEAFSKTRIIQIAAGDAHSLALEVGGTAYAWGFSTSGQLGTGAFSHDHSLTSPGIQQFTPTLVQLPLNKPIVKVETL